MKHTPLLLAILFPLLAFGQINWLENGQSWRFCSVYGWTNGEFNCDSLQILGDTVVAGKACKKVGSPNSGTLSVLYAANRKVYAVDEAGAFRKVYDFQMLPGETLDAGSFGYQIDSLAVADLGDFPQVEIQYAHIVSGTTLGISNFIIAEGIGFLVQPSHLGCVCGAFFPHLFSCDFNVDGKDTYLMAFQQNNRYFFPADTAICRQTSSPPSPPPNALELKIEPNPVGSEFRFSRPLPFSDGPLVLFNCSGALVRQWRETPTSFDLSDCPPGLYFLEMRREGRAVWRGKVVKQ